MQPSRLLNSAIVTISLLLIAEASARVVNISNAWVLPEEGFPVFYRYFRDRISWNEADAVCQFHHGNLVTVDSTGQYDAIRAYLKELDIANNVWIGLSRAAASPRFTWRGDAHELSAPDYWQEALPTGGDALCAAMDPAADFRWHALVCGGPEIASFICELPVPSWAMGSGGCMITELPSLTVLYIPEASAVELTSDCGLDGTKRIICKGNSDREELTKRLACNEEGSSSTLEEKPATTMVSATVKPTKLWSWTSNTIDGSPTRHRRQTEEDTPTALASDATTELATTAASTSTSEETSAPHPEEFANVIAQGQLFSIIDNGTLFDIIELNNTYENKKSSSPDDTSSSSTPTSSLLPSSTQQALVNVNREIAPSADTIIHDADDAHLKRTFRKKAPDTENPKLVEIVPKEANSAVYNNMLIGTFSRRNGKESRVDLHAKSSGFSIDTTVSPYTTKEYKSSEEDVNIEDVVEEKEEEEEEEKTSGAFASTAASATSRATINYDSEPTSKPNRQRQLTRTNRRSFYPYFFSRVLG